MLWMRECPNDDLWPCPNAGVQQPYSGDHPRAPRDRYSFSLEATRSIRDAPSRLAGTATPRNSHGRYSFVAKRPNSYGTRHLDSQVRQPLELGQVRQQAAAKLQVAAASGSRRAPPPPGAVLSWSSPNRCRARPLRRVRASRRGRRGAPGSAGPRSSHHPASVVAQE